MADARLYSGYLISLPAVVAHVRARTPGKARSLIYAMAVEAFGKRAVQFTDVRVKLVVANA